MRLYYRLEGREPVPVDDVSVAFSADRRVAFDKIGEAEVSTVFLCIDHSFGDGPPILFETMVFGGLLDQEQERYSTFDAAERGHAAMVERVRTVSP